MSLNSTFIPVVSSRYPSDWRFWVFIVIFAALYFAFPSRSVKNRRTELSEVAPCIGLLWLDTLPAIPLGITFLIHAQLPKFPELKLPKLSTDVNSRKMLWAFRVGRRALAYALFRFRRTSGLARPDRLGTLVEQYLVNRHLTRGPAEPA